MFSPNYFIFIAYVIFNPFNFNRNYRIDSYLHLRGPIILFNLHPPTHIHPRKCPVSKSYAIPQGIMNKTFVLL